MSLHCASWLEIFNFGRGVAHALLPKRALAKHGAAAASLPPSRLEHGDVGEGRCQAQA